MACTNLSTVEYPFDECWRCKLANIDERVKTSMQKISSQKLHGNWSGLASFFLRKSFGNNFWADCCAWWVSRWVSITVKELYSWLQTLTLQANYALSAFFLSWLQQNIYFMFLCFYFLFPAILSIYVRIYIKCCTLVIVLNYRRF